MARSRNMSFLPEDYLERRAARRTNLICITLFVIVVGGVVGAYWMTYQRANEVRQHHRQVDADFQAAAERLEQLDELQNRKQRTIHKAQVTSALIEHIPRTLLLAELINHMPMELSLLEFDLETRTVRRVQQPRTGMERRRLELAQQQQQEEDEAAAVEVPETEMDVRLEGVAPTDVEVAQFMTALSQHPMFVELNLQFSEQTQIRQQQMRKFRIAMKVDQSIDYDRIEPTRVERGLDHDPMAEMMEFGSDIGVPLTSDDGEWVEPAADDLTDTSETSRQNPSQNPQEE